MKSRSCTTPDYDVLYARWLENPAKLLRIGGYVPGQRLLDLCGGTGAVSKAALWAGPEPGSGGDPETILLYDLNPRFDGVPTVTGNVNDFRDGEGLDHPDVTKHDFDLIVCRQALAYFDFRADVMGSIPRRLVNLLAPRGKFIFNIFVKPKFSLQTYEFQGRRYFEASWHLWGRKVYHIQACRGHGWDMSSFFWYQKRELQAVLNPYFNCNIIKNGSGQTWVCTLRY